MAHSTESEAARRLLDSLESKDLNELRVDETLDAMIPEYVRAEIAGADVATLYSAVHEHILRNERAESLYLSCVAIESAFLSGEIREPSKAFKPDIAFLHESRKPALNAWQVRLVEFARRMASALQPGVALDLESFARPFFEVRSEVPEPFMLSRRTEFAFAVLGSGTPNELRWLEAVYQSVASSASKEGAELREAALIAARNAGLPRSLQTGFADKFVQEAELFTRR